MKNNINTIKKDIITKLIYIGNDLFMELIDNYS